MKKFFLTITCFIIFTSALFAQASGDTESLISSEVHILAKTSGISKLLKSVNFIVNRLVDEQTRSQVLTGRDSFRDKTGIDLLSEDSLKQNGIDSSRSLSFAVYKNENYNQVVLMFIPVFNEKEFPAKFNTILRKVDGVDDSFTTQKTTYKGITIYQIESGLFTAAFNGYFLVATTGEAIQIAVDLKTNNKDSLVLDADYKEYLSSGKNQYDINLYYSKRFIESVGDRSGQNYGLADGAAYLVLTQYGEEDGPGSSEQVINAIEYMAMGVGLDGKKIRMNTHIKVTQGNPQTEMILSLLQSNIQKNTLYLDKADTTVALGLNISSLKKICEMNNYGGAGCDTYSSFKENLKQSTGIDFEKEFLPYFSGVFNVIAVDSGGASGMGEGVLFLPMTDAGKTENIWNKLKKATQAQYGQQKMFGEEKLDGKKAFWWVDPTQMKFYVVFDARGLYVTNSALLVKAVMKGATLDKSKNSAIGKMVTDKTFMIVNIKKSMLLQQMMQMYTGNPLLSSLFSGVGEISLHAEKTDSGLSADMEVELKGK